MSETTSPTPPAQAQAGILKSIRRIALNLFVTLTGGYALNLTFFLVLRAAIGDRLGILALFTSFVHLLVLPALLLLPIALILRRRWLALMLLPAAATFILSYAPMFLPRAASFSDDTPSLSLLTYNLHMKAAGLETILEVLLAADADVIALQELNPAAAEFFATELAESYPYQALHPADPPTGQGVLSRYPLLSDEYWLLAQGHQRVTLDFQGESIAVYNAHPPNPRLGRFGLDIRLRGEELTIVLEHAAQETIPVIILGDFNMSDQSDDYRRVAETYHDSYRAAGWGLGLTFPDYTYPGSRPDYVPPVTAPLLLRLDYVFHSDHFQTIEAQVWPDSGGSDHRPVFARLALLNAGDAS